MNEWQLVVNSLAAGSLCVLGQAGMGRARKSSCSHYEQAGLFIAESQGGLVATIFLSRPKVFGVVPAGTDPERCWMPVQ